MLYSIGTILVENHISDFNLNREFISPDGGKRRLKNTNSHCTLKELMLRWLDKKRIRGLRWFYRPISSYKTGHKARVLKAKN
jgi:hypothetical protein